MYPTNSSGWMMVAVLKSQAGDGGGFQDNTLLFPAIMLIKLWLNAFVLKFSSRSLWRTFMGIGGVSLCLADTLLVCAMMGAWLLRRHFGTHVSLCFAMSHASAVYSLLPLPLLLLGTLDCASSLSPRARATARRGALFSRCTLVLSIWALAGLYSHCHTYSRAIEVGSTESDDTAVLCLVHRSSVVPYFCVGLCLAIACVLLFYCQRGPGCWTAAVASSWRWAAAPSVPHGGLPSSRVEPQKLQAAEPEWRPAAPLLLRLTLGFAFTWAPYLLLNVGCMIVGTVATSYMTVNLVWLLCANSLLVGATFWLKGGEPGPGGELLDDICTWSFYWQQADEEEGLGSQEKISDGTLSSCDKRDSPDSSPPARSSTYLDVWFSVAQLVEHGVGNA
ncbi:hypothetical protein AAFF_G00125000 [Aldrovandia affinis]|uniref:Uncharacterized protein n=1 Tax=Aldrovandia affinis TaxID=143900 RepID=A0AAD7RRA5_9TELE|nr:hypothetical protein AAFF_G00125000 [Aldrovandia affinis]